MDNFEDQNEASPWASRRKSIYLAGLVLLLSLISFLIFWQFWFKAPSCFDGQKNGDELGVDCGGSCVLVCQASVLRPIVRWDPRLFEVLPGVWSALVYIENPNLESKATYLPYSFKIFDQNNNILATRTGATILPRNKTVGLFEGSILIKDNQKPRRAIFEIDNSKIVWQQDDSREDNLKITHTPILRPETNPRVEAEVLNFGSTEIKNIELVIAIFDGADNAIASSRTFIERLKANEKTNIFFTWPEPFKLATKVCEKPSNTILLLDRSGSMSSIQKNPPEPLTAAKTAAKSFVSALNKNDRVGVISFATTAKEPIESGLSNDFEFVEQAIDSINIEQKITQYTNIYESLRAALQELLTPRAVDKSSKVVVLLTDGVANNPKDPNGRTEADDVKYAERLALEESRRLKEQEVIVYTIGLGDKVNEEFLKNIASVRENYFAAPSADNLISIYRKISSDICKEIPTRIEITYKIFDNLI